MNHDPDYVHYDPYIPHTKEEIRQWEEAARKRKEEAQALKDKMSKCSVRRTVETQKFHTAGQRITDPLSKYVVVEWIDSSGNIVNRDYEPYYKQNTQNTNKTMGKTITLDIPSGMKPMITETGLKWVEDGYPHSYTEFMSSRYNTDEKFIKQVIATIPSDDFDEIMAYIELRCLWRTWVEGTQIKPTYFYAIVRSGKDFYVQYYTSDIDDYNFVFSNDEDAQEFLKTFKNLLMTARGFVTVDKDNFI